MKQPLLKDDTFLEDVAQVRQSPELLQLWWLGQSGFLVAWQGRTLLLDPYLSDSLTRKYADTDKPHIRMIERVVAPERLDFIDVVTSSHNHTDHLDADTLLPLLQANPHLQIVVPEANRSFVAERLKVTPDSLLGIDAGGSTNAAGFHFHAVPAAHDAIEWDADGRCRFLGYVIECGPWKIYHSGDTLHYEGMEETLRPWKVDVALLPINGNRPERRVAGNLDSREAAVLGKNIGARLVIPCHYDMFEFNTASPDEFVAAAAELGQPYRILQCGQRWSSPVTPNGASQ